MKGDFSRGHRPDHKRGARYRRVLLQQGRLVLDSDVAASVDAVDRTIRDLAHDAVGAAGSPDGGYVVTPGQPVALFDSLDRVARGAGSASGFRFHRDYNVRLLDRHPTLCLDASLGAGSVEVTARRRVVRSDLIDGKVTLKVKLPEGVGSPAGILSARFDGSASVPLALLESGSPFMTLSAQVPTDMAHFDRFILEIAEHRQAWVGLIEGHRQATLDYRFWLTGGRYYVDGLAVELPEDAEFPEGAFPWAGTTGRPAVPVPPPTGGTTAIAYLEAREQLVTAVDDPGLREAALGGLDTTVRTRARGVVKLARVDGSAPDEELDAAVERAFRNVSTGSGRLRVTSAASAPNPDPCALPPSAGYAGADHRLYRFEVHDGGAPGASGASIKWSKNNGAELAGVELLRDSNLVRLTHDIGLRDGDLLEVTSEYQELWDGDVARVVVTAGAEAFHAPPRAVGELFAVRTTSHPREFTLHDPDTMASAPPSGPTADGVTWKARRWDGLLRTDPAVSGGPPTTTFALGDGVSVELSGANFAPGAWWEYEARAGASGLGESWGAPREPHGPERLFAPLARLEYNSDITPLRLRRWYDVAAPALGALRADDIRYDNSNVLAPPQTVQAALDELFLHRTGGCCEAELSPQLGTGGAPIGDAAERIAMALDEALPDGGVLCLRAGLYQLNSTVSIAGGAGRVVEIRGCPGAVLLCAGGAPAFTVDGDCELVLRDLVIRNTGAEPVVQFNPMGGASELPPTLRLRGVTMLHLNPAATGTAIRFGSMVGVSFDRNAPDLPPVATESATQLATVDVEDSVVVGWNCVLVNCLKDSRVARSTFAYFGSALYAQAMEGVEVEGCRLAVAYNTALRTLLTDLPASALRARARPLVEAAVAETLLAGAALPVGGGDAVLATRIAGFQMRHSWLSGMGGVWCQDLAGATFEGNGYRVGTALRAKTVTIGSLEREVIVADAFGVHVTNAVATLAVRACSMLARTGVLVGATPYLDALPPVFGLHAVVADLEVVDNAFTTLAYDATRLHAQVQIGPSPDSESLHAVLPTVGAYPTSDLLLKGLSYSGTLPPLRAGKLDRVTISRNRFTQAPGVTTDAAILCTLMDLPNVPGGDAVYVGAVDGNEIQSGMVGVLLRGCGWMVRGNTISRRTTVTPGPSSRFPMHAGVVLWDSGIPYSPVYNPPLATVAGNSIDIAHLSPGDSLLQPVAGVVIRGSSDLLHSIVSIQGNLIDCANALISCDAGTLHVAANTAGRGNVLIRQSTSLVFRGNRFTGIGFMEVDRGTVLMINDNDLTNLVVTGEVSRDPIQAFCQVMNNRVTGAIKLLPAVSGISVGSHSLPYAGTIVDYASTTLTGPQEEVVKFQVSNNSCSHLFVGNAPPALTSDSTLAHLCGNSVFESIAVRKYKQAVVVGNVARDLALPDPVASSLVILDANLNMP